MDLLVRSLVGANLIAQIVLAVLVARAVLFARRRRLRTHCRSMRAAVLVQIGAVVLIMTPALVGFVRHPPAARWFTVELGLHHAAGVLVLAFGIWVTLGFRRRLPLPRALRPWMRTAAALWAAALVMGLHMFVYTWFLHGPSGG